MVKSWEALEQEFRSLTPRSRAQWERGKPVMPVGLIKDAYWSRPHPIYMERADGCHLWDLDGRKYVDFGNHHTAMILGHNAPEVIEAVESELKRGIGLGAPTALEAEMAEELTSRFPSVEKIRFTNSGTESSLHVTRLVRAISGKPKVAKFEGAYHGSHDALEHSVSPSEEAAGPSDSPKSVADWKGMARGSEDDVVVLPYNQRESVELILREHQDEVGAVFFDGKPGLFDVPPDFTHFLRDLTRELGMIMVMDEVVSIRAGHGGYQGSVDVEPDLTYFGKIVGGGFPVGALGGRADLMDILDSTETNRGLRQSGTFSGNNFTLAAGLATLRALTPEVLDHLDGLRARLHAGMEEVFGRAGVPCQVLSSGSIVSFHLTDQPIRDFRSALSSDKDLFGRITLALLIKGQFTQQGLGFSLSRPMGTEEIDGVLSAIEETLAE